MSAVQRALLPRLGPLLVLLYCCSPVRWVVWGLQRREDKGIFFGAGGTRVGGGVARTPPLPLCPNWRRKLSERREKRGGGMKPTVFKLCLYVSPDCECATAFHNGGHCLFGGESVGILFQSFLKVLCLTRRGLSTSCGWRQACSLCPFPRLSAGICPLCPLCRSSGGSGLLLVHTCGDSQRCGCNSLDYICSVQLMSSVVLVMMVRGWQSSLCGVHSE